MGKKALISEMLKFHFGNQIFCTDGPGGILTHLFFDVDTRCLTYLAAKQGRFFGKTSLLPCETVIRATGEGIWLNCTQAQLAAASTGEGPGVLLNAHTVVKGDGGEGHLQLVAAHPGSGELSYIVVHNLPPGHNTLLQARYISALEPGQISISIEESVRKTLPFYRSDRELEAEVQQILFDLSFLHIDLKGMKLHVLDGTLSMDGNISSTLRGEMAQDQVSGVEGLLEIQNNLVGDDTLAATIALALGRDERTRGLPLGVYPQLGVVRLSGSVGNSGQAQAAVEIARQFDGVRDVVNNLAVDPSAAMLYVMAAPEGGEAKDITPGRFVRHTQ